MARTWKRIPVRDRPEPNIAAEAWTHRTSDRAAPPGRAYPSRSANTMSKRELEAKITLSPAELADYLHKLAESMQGGNVYIENQGQVLVLQPSGSVELEIEARQKKDKERLRLEIEWRRDATAPTLDPTLKITGGDPSTPTI
ncbi:MAG: amphi-Trp domain-containing protein [Myxococcales bacterium FL481]|nr:MAG: amphi-Trp domain-containing protein [Myxococcales bacterium FL481]